MPRKQHTVIKLDCGYPRFLVEKLPEVFAKNGLNPNSREHKEYLFQYCSADYYLNMAMVMSNGIKRDMIKVEATSLPDTLNAIGSDFAQAGLEYGLPVNYMMHQFVLSQRGLRSKELDRVRQVMPLIEERTMLLISINTEGPQEGMPGNVTQHVRTNG